MCWSLFVRLYAPRMTGTVWTPAQNSLQQVSTVLNPSMSCSSPNTSVLFALRAAGVRGICAHDCANGAADSVALCAVRLVAAADAGTNTIPADAPPRRGRPPLTFPPHVMPFHPTPDGRGTDPRL